MMGFGNNILPEPIEVAGDRKPPTPRLRLGSIREVRREMAKVYAEARAGDLPTSAATRLVYILNAISTLIRDSELEQRVQQLEQEIAGR